MQVLLAATLDSFSSNMNALIESHKQRLAVGNYVLLLLLLLLGTEEDGVDTAAPMLLPWVKGLARCCAGHQSLCIRCLCAPAASCLATLWVPPLVMSRLLLLGSSYCWSLLGHARVALGMIIRSMCGFKRQITPAFLPVWTYECLQCEFRSAARDQ